MMAELMDEEVAVMETNTMRNAMLTVHDVARMLRCSARTVYRLCDSGRMPKPVKLGALIRWPRKTIETWISLGCPRAKNMEVSR